MDWVLTLSLATFACVLAFLIWNRQSTKAHQKTGGNTTGIGGPNDPLSGTSEGIRPAGAIQANMEAAANSPTPGKGLLE